MLLNFKVIPAITPVLDAVLTSDKGLSIKGQVKEVGAPIPCRLRLFEKISGRLIADKLTDENGNYQFLGLNTNLKTFIVAFDRNKQFNAVIQDNVVPK